MSIDHRQSIIEMLRGAARAYTAEADRLEADMEAEKTPTQIIGPATVTLSGTAQTIYGTIPFEKIIQGQEQQMYQDPRLPIRHMKG